MQNEVFNVFFLSSVRLRFGFLLTKLNSGDVLTKSSGFGFFSDQADFSLFTFSSWVYSKANVKPI